MRRFLIATAIGIAGGAFICTALTLIPLRGGFHIVLQDAHQAIAIGAMLMVGVILALAGAYKTYKHSQ